MHACMQASCARYVTGQLCQTLHMFSTDATNEARATMKAGAIRASPAPGVDGGLVCGAAVVGVDEVPRVDVDWMDPDWLDVVGRIVGDWATLAD